MKRRDFAFNISALPASAIFIGPASAQSTATRHVAVVAPGFSSDSTERRAFREGLTIAGYAEGRDLSIDWWYGHGSYTGIADAVAKAMRNRVDVIVVESTVAALAAKHATQTTPIVMALVSDPVRSGLVE